MTSSSSPHPATGYTMWTGPSQPDAMLDMLQLSLSSPDFDWKSKALYYAEKCEQLGIELGNVRNHLNASCVTVRALCGHKRDIDPLVVSVTLEAHWQAKYIDVLAIGQALLSEKKELLEALELQKRLSKTHSEQFELLRSEHEFLTLRLADYIRNDQEMDAQVQAVSDIWSSPSPESPTHLLPMPDAGETLQVPMPLEVKLPQHDKSLKLDIVMCNMGYRTKSGDVAHVMACYQRAYIKQNGYGIVPKYYRMPGSDKGKLQSKRLTLLSESDLPMLTRIIREHGVKKPQ